MTLQTIVLITCLSCLAACVVLLVLTVFVLMSERADRTTHNKPMIPRSLPLGGARDACEHPCGHLLPLPEYMPDAGNEPASGDETNELG